MASFDLGSVVAHITADTKDFKRGLDDAKGQLDTFKGGLQSIGSSLADIGRQSAILAGVMGGGFLIAGKMALESAGKFEQYQIAFTTLLKDQAKAAEAIKNIQTDAAKTPFELAPLVAANQRLISAGVSAKDARADIINLGNAISATGGGGAELERLSVNLQQIKAVGKASALDVKQFAFAGINVYKLLADSTGKNVEQVKEMDITYDMLADSFEKASKKGGMFEGAMEKQSKSLNGLMSTLHDVVSIGLKDILVNSGLFDVIRNGVAGLIPTIESGAQKLTVFAQMLGQLAGIIQEMFAGNDMKAELTEFFSIFTGENRGSGFDKAAGIADVVITIVGAFKTLSDWVSENHELVITFLKGLAIALGALLIIGTITALIAAFTNPLVLVAMAIAALYTAWQTNFLGIRDITAQVFSYIQMVVTTVIMPLIQALSEWIRAHWTEIQIVTQGVWNVIVGIIQVAAGLILEIFTILTAIITGDWSKAMDGVVKAGELMWNGLKQIFTGIVQMIIGFGSTILKALVSPFEDAWHKIEDLMKKIKDGLDFTKRHSPSVVDLVNKGVFEVNRAFDRLEAPSMATAPQIASTIMPSVGGASMASVHVHMEGAIIADEYSANRISEIIGDNIIDKLRTNIRI